MKISTRTRVLKAAAIASAGIMLASCGGSSTGTNVNAENYPMKPVTLTAPADPGSGWDTTARALVQAMEKEGLTDTAVPVQNQTGATGCVWMSEMVQNHKGQAYDIAVTSTAVMSSHLRGKCKYGYKDVTMIATIAEENYVVVVPADSPYKSLDELLAAVAKAPQSVAIGASGDDQLPFALLVEAAGEDPAAINFIQYEGGGQQNAALLNGDVAAAVAGVSEFRGQIMSGDLTGLAVLREEPLDPPMADIPTTVSLGYDVTLGNWRGIYGPPDMPKSAVTYWQDKLKETLATPTWDDLAERNQWQELYMVDGEMKSYLDDASADIEKALKETGAIN